MLAPALTLVCERVAIDIMRGVGWTGGTLFGRYAAVPVSVWSAQRDHVGHYVVDVLLWYLEIHLVGIVLVAFHPLCQARRRQIPGVRNFGEAWRI